MNRDQKVAEAQRLRKEGEGLSLAAIAREMGVATSTVGQWLSDPTGEKERQRKQKYLNRCSKCGEMCYGERCKECLTWTEEEVKEAFREWVIEHGRPPFMYEWSKAHRPFHPNSTTVQRLFGSWNIGIEMAGFTPRPQAPPEWAQGYHGMSDEARKKLSEINRKRYEEDSAHPLKSQQAVSRKIGKQITERHERFKAADV